MNKSLAEEVASRSLRVLQDLTKLSSRIVFRDQRPNLDIAPDA